MNYVTFELESDRMICLKVDIPDELNQVDDECKAIYHCKTSHYRIDHPVFKYFLFQQQKHRPGKELDQSV